MAGKHYWLKGEASIMLKRILLLTCVLAVCAAGSYYPTGVAPTSASPAAPSNDPLHALLLATTHADIRGSLKGQLNRTLNSARQNLRRGNVEEAGTDRLAYLALLEEQSGLAIAPDVAADLIAGAEAALASLSSYPFAADYGRVPIVAVGPTSATSRDWRTHGVVTGVKDQGLVCQADYAFSATGAMEGARAISTGMLFNVSEQQLIDCDLANNGCQGGSPVRAMAYVIADPDISHDGGITTAASYPYTGTEGTCKFPPGTAYIFVSSLSRPQPGDEEALKAFVNAKGPVSVILRIHGSAWDNYAGGIFDPGPSPSGVPRYEAALVVGFGEQAGTPYWIVKTSKGTGWGDLGYALVVRGQNALGIADYVVFPVV
jgi:hypothetical protein